MAIKPYKPIISPVAPFDVNKECAIDFFYMGDAFNRVVLYFSEQDSVGTQPIGIEIVSGVETLGNGFYRVHDIFSHFGISNGKIYNLSLAVGYTGETDVSESTRIIVYTFSTPTFSLDVPSVVDASYLDVQLVYSQSEGERLDNFVVTLYDNKGKEVKTSGERYDTSNLNYTFKNLKNGDSYTLKANGTTVHGMTLNAQADFSVEYSQTQVYTYLTLDNMPEEGAVKISSEIISIEGESYPSPPTYINPIGDRMLVDLRAPDSWVKFNKGFNIKDDFLIQFKCSGLTSSFISKEILSIQNGNSHISVIFKAGQFDSTSGIIRGYLELNAHNGITHYVALSDFFRFMLIRRLLYVWIRHYKGAYEIHAVSTV